LNLAQNRQDSQRPLLVMFDQKACIECDELHQKVLMRPALAYALSNLDIAHVDRWSAEQVITPQGQTSTIRQWANERDISYAPTWVFFDKAGKEVFRSEAYLKAFHLHGAVDYVLSRAYDWQPNFQRFLQHRTEVLRARGFVIDLME